MYGFLKMVDFQKNLMGFSILSHSPMTWMTASGFSHFGEPAYILSNM